MRRHDIAPGRRRGRGAATNDTPRFETLAHVPFNDGWDIPEDLPFLRTHVVHEDARKILTRNRSPDIGFDRSVNPYRGCEHVMHTAPQADGHLVLKGIVSSASGRSKFIVLL